MNYLIRAVVFHLFLIPAFDSVAQLCTGSLGNPVVNIHFGNATNPDLSFTPPAAYTYIASACPNDGYYTVVSETEGCFGNSWLSVMADHTGGGAFMLVNASYEPGDFFRTTVSNLCPNTTYEFASWVMNVMRSGGISPDLTFRIERPDGSVLGQYSTGPILTPGTPVWQQFGFFFTTPANNQPVVLRITNNAPGGIGNDLALDDITFRPCGPTVIASNIGFNGPVEICEKDTSRYVFTADPSFFYISPDIQWQQSTDSGSTWKDIPGAVGNTYTRKPTRTGHYWYRFAVAESGAPEQCRINSNILIIHVWPLPQADAGPDRALIQGDTVTLRASTDIGVSYNWQPGMFLSSANELNPDAFPPYSITYKLSVLTDKGCLNEDYVSVRVSDKIYIPTAFTPNQDGLNDYWRVPYLDPEWDASLKIFDRHGRLVYQGEGPSMRWDGNRNGVPQSPGVYVYLLFIRSTGKLLKGSFVLIR
ncbi:MAG: gliding motility-associated C-terminal domain-containing protein [Chitinophagaceae bacterium]